MDSDPSARVFHVELKQFPSTGRRFNLTREQLNGRFLVPWLAGKSIELDDKRYLPEKAKLRILEGPPLRIEEIGLGRGWANAERAGEDITERVLAQATQTASPTSFGATVEEFKSEVVGACTLRRIGFGEVVQLASVRYPRSRVSERLGLAERAVWELLHEGRVAIFIPGADEPVPREHCESIVLAWDSWKADAAAGPVIASTPAESLSSPS